jgi:hypothetical protein
MTREAMRQVMDNIYLPDTVFLSPEDIEERYEHLIELLGINTSDECYALYDVIQDIIQHEKKGFEEEDKRICASILAMSHNDVETAYEKNEKNKEDLNIRLIPFASYICNKAEDLALKEIENGSDTERGFKIIQRMLNKYHEIGLCSSIMVIRSDTLGRECISGHPKDVMLMLAAAINGRLDGLKSTEYEMNMDEYLLDLAERMRDTKAVDSLAFANRHEPSIKKAVFTKKLTVDGVETNFEKIGRYLNRIQSADMAYIVCVKMQNNVKCLLGGNEEKMKDIFVAVINALICSGYEPYGRFNKIAAAIKNAVCTVKTSATTNEYVRV